MVLITRHNYEAFLLDYIEGNLSEQDTAGLMRFLDQNPELKEDLEDFDWITLTNDSTDFEGKEDLKIKAEIEELLIGRIEKVNAPSDEARLNALLLAHPQYEKDEKQFAATILASTPINFSGKEDIKLQAQIEELLLGRIEKLNTPADDTKLAALLVAHPQYEKVEAAYGATVLSPEQIEYPFKAELKQESKVIPIYFWYSAAAACVIGFMATFGWNNSNPDDLQYATNPVNLSTTSLAIEKLPDFSVFSTADNLDSTKIDAVEGLFIAPNNPIDINIAGTGPKKNRTPIKKTNKQDSTIDNTAPIALIPSDEVAEVVDSIPSVMDSIINATSPIDPITPDSDNIAMSNGTETRSLGEFVTFKTREKIFGEEEPTYNAIQTNEILSNMARGVDKITASKVSYSQEETAQGKSTKIKIGKFELYRSAR